MSPAEGRGASPAPLRIGMLGNPLLPDAEWSDANLTFLTACGFTAIQLNIAWSWRPGDEPLNLEDVVTPADEPLAHGADPGPAAWLRRRRELAERSTAAHRHGLRTIFHCGIPYNGRSGYEDGPLSQCILDPATTARYVALMNALASEFPAIDDILMYTYDQEAWLCSEFGSCRRCRGIPLHKRVTPFVNELAAAWRSRRPGGRLWWEPWELSAGQLLAAIPHLNAETTGLMLHSSAAEVISVNPADRFVRNAAASAAGHRLPLVVELFLTSMTEETEPYRNVTVPLITLGQLRALARLPGLSGIKEYYGITPRPDDPNLAAAAAYFADPDADDKEILRRIAIPYGTAARNLVTAWTTASEAYALIPWDASWFMRQIGRSVPTHALSAATVRGMQSGTASWNTPNWRSTRRLGFMRTDNTEPHPWLLEDVQLRCEQAAVRLTEASAQLKAAAPAVPASLRAGIRAAATDLAAIQVRLSAYALHLRATNLAQVIRACEEDGLDPAAADLRSLLKELRAILQADLENQRRAIGIDKVINSTVMPGQANTRLLTELAWVAEQDPDPSAIEKAIAVLDRDAAEFLRIYLRVPEHDTAPCGQFSLTSR